MVAASDVLDADWRDRILSDAHNARLHEADARPRRSPDEVVRVGAHEPVTPALVGELAELDPVDVDAGVRVGLAVAWDRVRNYATARLAEVVAADVRAGRDVHAADGRVVIEAERLTSAEMGAALRHGNGAADRLVDVAVALARRLPATRQAMLRGDLSWAKAAALADATATLTPQPADDVERFLLPGAPRRIPSRHRAAVRRAVDRIDPAGSAERHRRARADVVLIRTHYGAGMGELFARMPSDELDAVWTGADEWARRHKAAGDARTLDQLRVAALVQWATGFLAGAPTAAPAPADTARRPDRPQRHGSSRGVAVLCTLGAIVGVTETFGELADSAATVPAERVRELLDKGGRLRRLLVDAGSGELVDLSARTWSVPPNPETTPGTTSASPYSFDVVVDTADHAVLTGSDPSGVDADRATVLARIRQALDATAEPLRAALRALLDHPATSPDLDATPAAYPTPVRLAQFVTARDRHPVTPTSGASAASAGDVDHITSIEGGGATTRDGLATLTRRWHVLKTHTGWSYRREGHGWLWTSPAGRRYRTHPHDYRLGP
jgi:hypothetical protein